MSMKRCVSLPVGVMTVVVLLFAIPPAWGEAGCGRSGLWLQVLGSGGPELDDGRASSGYLLWRNGRARLLVDLGAGSLKRFEDAQARVEDLDAILLTHLHVDHSADLPALIKGSFFSSRRRDLPLYGPDGNVFMPDTRDFVRALFAADQGAYRYLADYLSGEAAYRLVAENVPAGRGELSLVIEEPGLTVRAAAVHHGPVPALAWRIEMADTSIVISGDMNGDYDALPGLAKGADMLIAHHAVPEGATGVARNLHMPPSVIGRIAGEAGVGRVVLSHRMNRTLGRESESLRYLREHYRGAIDFADDGSCYRL